MLKTLVKFWLLRFVQVLVLACAVLGGIEALQHRGEAASYRSVLVWAVLAATATATVSAWWACKRQCKLVFKDR